MVSCRCEEILTFTLSIFHVCSPMFIQNSHFHNIFIYCNIIVFLYLSNFPHTQTKWINKLIKTFSSLITPFHFSNHFSNSISHLKTAGNILPGITHFTFRKASKLSQFAFGKFSTPYPNSRFEKVLEIKYPISLFETLT